MIHGTDRGTHQAEIMGVLPTSRPVTLTFTTIYRIADGKITEERGNADSLGLLQQLGVVALQRTE